MSVKVTDWKPIPKHVRMAVFDRSGGRCWYCGCDLDPDGFDVDHVVPKSAGGAEGDNLVPACRPCNRGKRDRTIEEFRAMRQRQRDGMPLFSDEQRAWLLSQGFVFSVPAPYLFWFEQGPPT